MALERKDSVADTSTTIGTGTLTLAGSAPAGRLTFAASGLTTGATVRYRISQPDESEWEVGEGVWTSSGATLTRVTVFASSNSGSLVSFSAGTKDVSLVMTAADIPAFVGCKAYNNGAQSIPASTNTAITFNSEEWDSDAIHSTSSNTSRFTVPAGKDGKWEFSWSVQFNVSGLGQRIGFLRKNGGTDADNLPGSITRQPGSSSVECVIHKRTTGLLAAGDYVELFVYQDSGGAVNSGTSSGGSNNASLSVMEARFLG